MIEYGVENKLRIILGKKYSDFISHFEFTAAPAYLKDKSIFLTGFRNGDTTLTGALLIKQNGNIFVAYYDKKDEKINYYGPRNETIPLSINAWRSDLLPTYNINQVDEEFNSSDIDKNNQIFKNKISLPTKLGIYDYDKFRSVMSSIWNPLFIMQQNIVIDDDVADVIARAEQEIFDCSKALGYVPSIKLTQPGVLTMTFEDIIKNYVQDVLANNYKIGHDQRHALCITGAALTFKSDLINANLGLN